MSAEPVPPPGLVEWMEDAHNQIVDLLPDRTPASLTSLLEGTMLAECLGHFLAVLALLKERLVSQAMIVNRSLVETTTLLAYMSHHGKRADELALRYWWGATNRELELVREGERIHGVDVSKRLGTLEEDLRAVEAEAQRLGIADFRRRLPSTGDMARELSSAARAMRHGIDLLSLHVHSSRTPLAGRLHPGDGGLLAGLFSPRESREDWHVLAGVLATVAMVDAAAAVSRLQGWDSVAEVARVAEEVGKGWRKQAE